MTVKNVVFLSGKMPISFLVSLCYTYFCSQDRIQTHTAVQPGIESLIPTPDH